MDASQGQRQNFLRALKNLPTAARESVAFPGRFDDGPQVFERRARRDGALRRDDIYTGFDCIPRLLINILRCSHQQRLRIVDIADITRLRELGFILNQSPEDYFLGYRKTP
jgi:hypothetical protein